MAWDRLVYLLKKNFCEGESTRGHQRRMTLDSIDFPGPKILLWVSSRETIAMYSEDSARMASVPLGKLNPAGAYFYLLAYTLL